MTTRRRRARHVSEVRPYVITRGRVTAAGVAFDTLLAVAPGPVAPPRVPEAREVLRLLGDSYLTVAEVAARLRIPLGTAQVLAADLSESGAVRLFGAWAGARDLAQDDDRIRTLALLGSVIDGIDGL